MRVNLVTICSFFFLMAVIQSCQPAENTTNVTPTLMLSDPHYHVVDVNQAWPDPQIVAEFSLVEVSVDSGLERENVTVNQDETLQAFTICNPIPCQDRIFIEELKTGQVYEIQGLPLPWRPFSDLIWVTTNVLVFDRWSQPHYGVHYAVDFIEKRLILASPFPDQLSSDIHPSKTPTVEQ